VVRVDRIPRNLLRYCIVLSFYSVRLLKYSERRRERRSLNVEKRCKNYVQNYPRVDNRQYAGALKHLEIFIGKARERVSICG